MYRAVVRNTRLLVASGIAAIVFGVLALVWPSLTFVALLALFGAYALVDGVLTVAAGLNLLAERQTTWVPYILGGLAGIAVGAVTFLRPGITALSLVYLIAFWAILVGVFEIIAAFELAGEVRGDWMLGLAGGLSIAFGILVALRPGSGALSIVFIVGIFAILAGLSELAAAYRLHGFGDKLRSALQPAPGRP